MNSIECIQSYKPLQASIKLDIDTHWGKATSWQHALCTSHTTIDYRKQPHQAYHFRIPDKERSWNNFNKLTRIPGIFALRINPKHFVARKHWSRNNHDSCSWISHWHHSTTDLTKNSLAFLSEQNKAPFLTRSWLSKDRWYWRGFASAKNPQKRLEVLALDPQRSPSANHTSLFGPKAQHMRASKETLTNLST